MQKVFYPYLLVFVFLACNSELKKPAIKLSPEENALIAFKKDSSLLGNLPKALVACEFNSLKELKNQVQIKHFDKQGNEVNPSRKAIQVVVTYENNGQLIKSSLSNGLSQSEVKAAARGALMKKFDLSIEEPRLVKFRRDLAIVNLLARRRQDLNGWGDPAFYDISEATLFNIVQSDFEELSEKQKGSKGLFNSINHITAQAFITSCFSEEVGDLIADLHERDNMPELISGLFKEDQLSNPLENPQDNFVDMINNEIGQELGKRLKVEYRINSNTYWTPELLSSYLNNLLQYYSWSFGVGFKPFSANQELMIKFADKLNKAIQLESDLSV